MFSRFVEHDYSAIVQLNRDEIRHKAMQCGSLILEWRKEWSQSKYDE